MQPPDFREVDPALTDNPDAVRAIQELQTAVAELIVGFATSVGISSFDESFAATSVPASTTVVLESLAGRGTSAIHLVGDGHKAVDIVYSVDGAPDTVIGHSDKAAIINVAFNQSLIIRAVNTSATPRSCSSVSSTGLLQ